MSARRSKRWVLSLALAALVCIPVAAQPGNANLVIDTEAATGGLQNLGVQYLGLDPNFPGDPEIIVVSGAGNTGVVCASPAGGGAIAPYTPGATFTANAAPHMMYAIDVATGAVIRAWCQATTNQTSAWGHRDLATDWLPASGGGPLAQNLIFGGDETGLYCYDRMGNLVANPILFSANGPIAATATYPLFTGGVAPNGNPRALAYDPWGNGGNGSFFTASFGSDMIEFDINGNQLGAPYPNASGWSLYGLALDRDRTEFAISQGQNIAILWGSTSPNAGDLVEIIVDRTAGTATESGTRIQRTLGGAQGGLSMAYGRTGGSYSELCCLTQNGTGGGLAGVDAVAFQRFDLVAPNLAGGGSGFTEELQLVTQVNASGYDTNAKGFFLNDLLSWNWATRPGSTLPQTSTPGIIVANLPPDSAAGPFNTLGIPELVVSNPLSVPAGTPGANFIIADGIGVGLPSLGLGPNGVGDPAPTLPWAFPGLLNVGDVIRIQGFAADLGVVYPGNPLPGYATNVAEFTYQGAVLPNAVFTATGGNNFPGNPAAPFWTLTNQDAGGRTITSFTIDVAGTGLVFDYDQAMYAVATGGNANLSNGNGSPAASCSGTVVSDPGIDYNPATSTFGPGSLSTQLVACDPAAFSGWSTTSALVGNCTNLTWTFLPGMFGPGTSMAWDGDTDGGPGVSGDLMAGITITITWSDATTSTGTLAATVPGLTSSAQIF